STVVTVSAVTRWQISLFLVRLQDIRRLCVRKSSKTPVLYAGYAQRYPAFSPAARCLPGLHLRTHAMPDDHRIYSYSAVLMGSPILLKLFSHDEALASRVFRLIKQYEDLLTVNRAHSEVMDINHAAGQHPVAVSRPVFELIRCAKDRKSTRLNSSHVKISYAVFCLKKKNRH